MYVSMISVVIGSGNGLSDSEFQAIKWLDFYYHRPLWTDEN